MEDLVLASSEADAQAAERLVAHHAEIDAALSLKVELVITAARSGHHGVAADAAVEARGGLSTWCKEVLLPHTRAAEATLCRAGAELSPSRLLVEAMLVEHRIIWELVGRIGEAHDALDAALAANALKHAFAGHLVKVNDQLLPLLVRDPGTSVAVLLEELERAVTSLAAAQPEEHDDGYGHPVHDAGSCACNERDVSGHPELDARAIPHAIRHSTVFGALDAVRPGKALILVAPHDPIPLLRQLEGRSPGVFAVDYLQRGPDAWRLLVTRTSA